MHIVYIYMWILAAIVVDVDPRFMFCNHDDGTWWWIWIWICKCNEPTLLMKFLCCGASCLEVVVGTQVCTLSVPFSTLLYVSLKIVIGTF